MLLASRIIGAFIGLVLAGTAVAIPVGSINFAKESGANWAPTGGTNISDATGIDFTSGPSGFTARVIDGTESYAGPAAFGSKATFNDFVFDPLSSGQELWTFDYLGSTYSMDMGGISYKEQTADHITLRGWGTAYLDAESSGGTWYLNLSKTGSLFNFHSDAVPAPGIALLLGAGLIGLGAARRARKDNAIAA